MINNNALVSMLVYMKQKIHGIGASQEAGHFPEEQYVRLTWDTVQYH
jgi:hypothetical protein